jgi:hypothetical protein
MKIGNIGAGNIGVGLGKRLAAKGHDIVVSFSRTTRIGHIFSIRVAHSRIRSYMQLRRGGNDRRQCRSRQLIMLIYSAPASAVLAELFPTSVRATGISLTYSLGAAICGGFTPAITTAMVNWTGAPVSLTFHLMGASLVGSIAVPTLNGRTGEMLS